MSWKLGLNKPASDAVQHIPIRDNVYLALLGTQPAVMSMRPADNALVTTLGHITVTSSGAKLEAVDHALVIQPGADPRTVPYELQPRVGECSEVIFLRHGDVINSRQVPHAGSFTCAWNEPEIQVNSSAAELGGVKNSSNADDEVDETPEEETEDEDEDLDNTVTAVAATQTKSQLPDATPQLSLSNERSVVVQETPTAPRVNAVTDYSGSMEIDPPDLARTTPTPEPSNQAAAEPYSTACTTRQSQTDLQEEDIVEASTTPLEVTSEVDDAAEEHRRPRVVIAKKRPNPALDQVESETEPSRSKKRSKKVPSDDDTQDSRLDTIAVKTSPAATLASRVRQRKPVFQESTQETPSQSQRSQRSTSAVTTEPYQGDIPRVATSNSALTDKSQAAKFLKRQGGSFVDSVQEPFNILCVKDGDLNKTGKVLYAIATGTPIVTDKWLIDSAKAGHFLSVESYYPVAKKKEKDWRFKLGDVLGQPQTPFEGYTVHFTTSLHSTYKPFAEIEHVCKAAGAKVTKKKMDKNKSDKTIVLAVEDGDTDAEKLMGDGVICYTRDLVSFSILRGTLDLESDEFKVKTNSAKNAGTRKKGGKKS